MDRDVVIPIREQIARQIRNDVIFGRIAEGQPLREVDLAKRFGVSRGPIRDVLLQLAKEGLLVAEPNRGTRVGRRSNSESRPLVVELRRKIEEHALERIFPTITPDDIETWEVMLDRFRTACSTKILEEVVENDMAFHRSLIKRTGDETLLSIWVPIITHMWLPYTRHSDLMESYHENLAIFTAIKAGQLRTALSRLRKNIQ